MKTQIVGFILFLSLCVLVPLGVASPAPYTISYSGPSHIPPGGSGTFTFTVKKDGIPQSGVTMYIYRRPETNSYLSNDRAVTDANGEVQMTLTLESAASGTYRITASAPDREGGKEFDEDIDYVRFNVIVSNSPPPPPPEPSKLVKISDDNQIAAPGDSVPLVVELQNSDGNPISGSDLNFILFGDPATGSLSPITGTTGANGRAQTMLTLSSDAEGEYIVEAHRINDFAVYVHFTVTVDTSLPPQDNQQQQQQELSTTTPPPPIPTTLEGISGDNQNGLTGEVLANPFVVELRDQNSNPMEGVTVTFAVSAGGGSLSNTSVDTDANGLAQSILTLGNNPGANTVTVSVEGISQMVVFNAEASLPLPMPTALSIISGDNQSGLTGEALADPFVVEVRDQNGNPLEGVTVTFTVSAGGGSLSDTSVDTDANGLAQTALTLGNDPGTNAVEASVEEITETATFNAVAELLEFDLSLPSGISLIHVPLRVRTVDGMAVSIESVADLYNALGGVDTVNWLITYNSESQDWDSYFGDSDRGMVADRILTDHTGILASIKTPVSVRLGGDALGVDGSSTITLNAGLNLVGLPLKDSRVMRVSDLFALAGIADNVPVIIVSDNGELKAVGRAGDPSDIEITGGQSFILTAQQAATVTISGHGWDNTASGTMAAPPITMRGIQATGITPVLALSGSIVDSVNGINSAGLRVSVKNLSTGSAVATVVGDMGSTSSQVGYRLTVVDIADGRAAAIGDTLEISVRSPDMSIGVQPLRYTVTVEDIKRHRIHLPELVVQEIPAETELLRNYPNPFNPETWIPYRLAQDAFVTLTIYDGNGQMVRTLDVGHQTAAVYENRSRAAYWDGRNYVGESVASGVYFYTLTAGDFSATRKMVILK